MKVEYCLDSSCFLLFSSNSYNLGKSKFRGHFVRFFAIKNHLAMSQERFLPCYCYHVNLVADTEFLIFSELLKVCLNGGLLKLAEIEYFGWRLFEGSLHSHPKLEGEGVSCSSPPILYIAVFSYAI